ncbi:Uncharacterised protein [Porphyromonas cangingivalis]|nr:Uncharacterised protein [Porphyromonas cangingivalis]
MDAERLYSTGVIIKYAVAAPTVISRERRIHFHLIKHRRNISFRLKYSSTLRLYVVTFSSISNMYLLGENDGQRSYE